MTDDELNVNSGGNVSHEVNVKRLGQQQKAILRHFHEHEERMFQQVEVIEALYGEVTDSRKASVSRSISQLRDHGLVFEQQRTLITPDDHPLVNEPYYRRHRPRYQLTDDGRAFLESDDRFPGIP